MRIPSLTLVGLLMAFGVAEAQRVETGFLDRVAAVDGHEFRYQVYLPHSYTSETRWPVILFLHGAGERGSDGLSQTAVGLGPAIRRDPTRYPAITIFPQAPEDSLWVGVPAEAAMAALRQTLEEFSADASRVYLTGLSMGGHGTWYLAYRYPETFAAVVPICAWVSARDRLLASAVVVPAEDGEPFEALAERLKGVPVWIFHGEVDAVVLVEESRKAAAAFQSAGAEVRYTELLGVDHNSWDAAFGSVELSTWLFQQQRQQPEDSGIIP